MFTAGIGQNLVPDAVNSDLYSLYWFFFYFLAGKILPSSVDIWAGQRPQPLLKELGNKGSKRKNLMVCPLHSANLWSIMKTQVYKEGKQWDPLERKGIESELKTLEWDILDHDRLIWLSNVHMKR